MDDLTFVHEPRISIATFARVLASAASPAAGDAGSLAMIPTSMGIDRAVALAFFHHESSYGTVGVARTTLNWGNLRLGPRQTGSYNGFAKYTNWQDSLRDWSELILRRYVGTGLTTVRQAIPVYAPAADHNAPDRYIAAVLADVARYIADEQAHSVPSRAYRVRVAGGARVRSGPGLGYPVLTVLAGGAPWSGVAVPGGSVTLAPYGTSDLWVQDDRGRCVWSLLLEPV